MPKHTYRYKAIKRAMGKALHRYGMLADGDRVLVGVSGGKDSLTLLWMLRDRLRRIPISYQLFPVYIDPGFENGYSRELGIYGRENGYHLRVELTDYGVLAHSRDNRENPCFLCARLRRKRLFEIAHTLKCNKIALGHHKDDIIETLFLNMCYAGEISTMLPNQSFFSGEFAIIRPLALVDEATIQRFASEMDFPSFQNPCPSAKNSKRHQMKAFLRQLYRGNNKIKGNIFRSLGRVKMDYLW